jgi:hypothetical protein
MRISGLTPSTTDKHDTAMTTWLRSEGSPPPLAPQAAPPAAASPRVHPRSRSIKIYQPFRPSAPPSPPFLPSFLPSLPLPPSTRSRVRSRSSRQTKGARLSVPFVPLALRPPSPLPSLPCHSLSFKPPEDAARAHRTPELVEGTTTTIHDSSPSLRSSRTLPPYHYYSTSHPGDRQLCQLIWWTWYNLAWHELKGINRAV